ncbi:Cytokinesis regulator (Byr4) [Geosmithia morbida]|uniref:Cytokinesis regulator (Byr4) n=1 Tax=Geosmithia morbida TaxID=1094350 RepID=A0A9P4Z1J4_9HYPO|nr:Cytokinesis regulator (Byr4) [Geosmithia morbida]KAF4126432.1 Cytokinesis regulator (Byr4) [Geosmithia morbida]
METLSLKPRRPVEEEIECWDDGDFMTEGDDVGFRTRTSSTIASNAPTPRRRDSNSSHMSFRSDLESWAGEDERHVQIPGDDEKSILDAIAAAQRAGIPVPKDVPSSALMGGTIKRLGGRKLRTVMHEDWESDLELPDVSQVLKVKSRTPSEFSETLIQFSDDGSGSPFKKNDAPSNNDGDNNLLGQTSNIKPNSAVDLNRFKDDDDDDIFGGGFDTIKVTKRQSKPLPLVTPPTPQKEEDDADDFEKDLELPSSGTLRLSTRRDIPKTPSSTADDLDWDEGSLGTRHGGTWRDARSTRSSSASALSPSISSSLTAESEDETFDGLVLPAGPVNFKDRLQHRHRSRSPERIPEEPAEPSSPPKKPVSPAEADRPGFLDGLEIGDGDVFNSKKLTLHKNIKVKDAQPSSPARPRTAVSVTFSNTSSPSSSSTRIPRLNHERTHSTSLEPVSESGGPIFQRARRPQSRLSHSTQSSVSSIPTPTTPSASSLQASPPTPSRRELGPKASTPTLRNEPTTTNAQLLKQKRSLPAIRALNPPTRQSSFRAAERPPSRESGRPQSSGRPKTPVDRQRTFGQDSPALSARKGFLPSGASTQPHHATAKTGRQFRRYDSETAIDFRSQSRNISSLRSPSPQRYRVAADTWERLSRPKNKKNFGDGHELDAFDDLPTSKEAETKFMKQPVASSTKPMLRHRSHQSIASDRTSTPTPTFPMHRGGSSLPNFARDTTASRIARETSLAHRSTSSMGGPLAQVNAQRGPPLAAKGNSTNTRSIQPSSTMRSKKPPKRPPQLKPHLISNLGHSKESKLVNGMFYNPETFRWEGNDNALNAFDTRTVGTPTPTAATPHSAREKEVSTPRPALITNISATKGIQVVNGMVFDPENMCWMKLGSQHKSDNSTAGILGSDIPDKMSGAASSSDEEDPFKDIPDLDDNHGTDDEGVRTHGGRSGRVSDINDDWLVGEEFDVGPEFIRRQREEEDRWRKKCEKWTGRGVRDRDNWRWTIRELVSQFDQLPV